MPLKLRQIGFADLVVLNKTDLVGPEHLEVIREWIGLHKQPVRIIETTYSEIPLEILLGAGRFDPAAVATLSVESAVFKSDHHADASAPKFDRWSYRTAEPFSVDALQRMVQRDLPESVYRCKGLIYAADSPDSRLSLQVVGGRTQITDLDELFDACLAGRGTT